MVRARGRAIKNEGRARKRKLKKRRRERTLVRFKKEKEEEERSSRVDKTAETTVECVLRMNRAESCVGDVRRKEIASTINFELPGQA